MRWLVVLALLPMAVAARAPAPAPAKSPPAATPAGEAEHRKVDIARHRQMASAHEEAARCLESGAAEKECHARLREMCKGIAVGQYCGMRHGH